MHVKEKYKVETKEMVVPWYPSVACWYNDNEDFIDRAEGPYIRWLFHDHLRKYPKDTPNKSLALPEKRASVKEVLLSLASTAPVDIRTVAFMVLYHYYAVPMPKAWRGRYGASST